ncbi:hypothetical protein ACB098_02G058400 [Castanea mollissima]
MDSRFFQEYWAFNQLYGRVVGDGLIICNNLNYSAIDIQIDAKTIVGLLSIPSYFDSFVMPIVDDCKQLIYGILQVRIGRYYCEANSCVDFLAKMGSSQTW